MTHITISFHPLSHENLEDALRIASKVFPANAESIESAYKDSLNPSSERLKKRRLLKYFVAKEDAMNKIVAVTGLYNHLTDHSPSEVWLGWFCVDPDMRGKGIGRETLEWTIQNARKMGYEIFRLYTSTDPNEKEAQNLYESVGLKIYKREPSDEHPEEEILYRELPLKKSFNNYTEIAPYYDQIVSGGYYDMPKFAAEYKEIIGPDAKKVLEVGIGTGGLSQYLKNDYQMTGVDFSEALLSIAKEKLKGTGVELVRQDILDFNRKNSFDAAVGHGSIFIIIESKDGIVAESFLTKIDDVRLALRNICESLKKGAKLIWDFHAEHVPGKRFVSLPNGNRYEFELKEINGMREFYKLQQIKDSTGKLIAQSVDHKLRIPIEEFKALAIESGFKSVEKQGNYLVLTKS